MTGPTEPRGAAAIGEDGGNREEEVTILVVEDEEALRRLVTRMLRRMGYRTLEADDGVAGLETAREVGARLDLVLSDVVMPRLSGPDMAAELREGGSAVPVAFMSGYSGEELAGAEEHTHFLPKPFTMGELGDFISTVLESR